MKPTVRTDDQTLVTLDVSKHTVEAYLNDYFTDRLASASAMDPSYARLWRSFQRLFETGGKRIRPYVTMLTYQAYAPLMDAADVVPAAAAQELLHLAMLVHDDVIDRDRIRYGIANVSGQYDEHYEMMIPDKAERRHYADSAAILAGDLLLSDAYELLARCNVDPRQILQSQRILNDAVFEVVGGELLDTETAFSEREHIRPLDIAKYKTASYSFVSPLTMGAMFAGADESELELLQKLGVAIGSAYQLQDDILGMFGSSASTGKSTVSDLEEGKYTFLIQLFYEHADDIQIRTYEQIAGTPDLSYDQAETARTLLKESGALHALEAYISDICADAKNLIDQLSISTQHKQALHELLNASVRREK